MRIRESTRIVIPLLLLFIMLGLLSGIVGMFFLIASGKHEVILYQSIGYGLVLLLYFLILFTGYFYLMAIISKIRDDEKIKEQDKKIEKYEKEFERLKKNE